MPEFIDRYPKSRILLAANGTKVDWEQHIDFSGFTLTEIAPLDERQASLLITRWFEYCANKLGLDAAVSLRKRQIIQNWIEGENGNHSIIGNPLMLTLWVIILLFAGDFIPESREDLFERAMEVLTSCWIRDGLNLLSSDLAASASVNGVQPESHLVVGLQRILGRLVYRKVIQTASNHVLQKFSFDEVMDEVSSIDFGIVPVIGPLREVREIGGGILVSDQEGDYTLLHEIFQEPLMADYLTAEDDLENLISLFLSNPQRWQEVLILCSKKIVGDDLDPIWKLLDMLYQRGSSTSAEAWVGFVAGKILGEIDGVREECPIGILSKTQAALLRILEQSGFPARERALAGFLLDELGDPRFNPGAWFLPNDPLLGFIEIPGGNFIMGTPETDVLSLIDEFGIGSDWKGLTLGAMLSQEPNIDALITEMGLKEGWQGLDSSELLIQWYRREVPQHELDLPTFYLARYPVTTGQFRAFVEASGYEPEIPEGLEGVQNHPIAHITWSDAMRYCTWLTQIMISWEGTPDSIRSLLQEGWRITLPSEAEWEKAARGSANHRIYPWGDQFDSNCANLKETNLGKTSTVGCFPDGSSPYGLLDMAGNVWEWTRSLWGEDEYIVRYPYPYDPLDGREDTVAGNELCVLRGASYNNYRRYARCTTRRSPLPVLRTSIRGFRIALSIA
jgi:formylglycine-generating enzyme required for sulfatase activity